MNKRVRNDIELTKIQLSAAICFIGIFIFGSVIRYGVYRVDYIQKYSPLMILGLILVYLYSRGKNKDMSLRRFDKRTLPTYILLVIYCFTLSLLQGEFRDYLQINIILAASIIITLFRFRSSDEYIDVLRLWTAFLRLCALIMFFGELIDVVFNMSATKFFADFSGIASLDRMYRQGRSVTYMGHSLFSAELYLICYCFDHILYMVDGKRQKKWVPIVSLLGVALTQSRATFALLLLLFLFLNLQTGRIKNLILFLIAIMFVYEMGFLDGIINRIVLGLESGDISSGRNTSIQMLISTGELNIKWFGGRVGYDETASLVNMSLEYPILSWACCYGIAGALLFVVLLFIYPLKVLLARRQTELFLIGITIMLCVNGYAGLSTSGIQPLVYYITICMLLNASNYFKMKQKAQ